MNIPTSGKSQELQVETGKSASGCLDELLARQEQAWKQGISISIERLALELHPPFDRNDAILALICNEVVLRERASQTPSLEEYQQRFPELSEALHIQWEIDRLLQADESQIHLAHKTSLADRGIHDTQSVSDSQAHLGPDIEQQPQAIVRFGRYELQEEVGRGAIGVVYRAWDPLLKRIVALKRIRGGMDVERIEIDRIAFEAESIAKIHHPHIVQIYDVGQQHGQPFLAMEFCRGGSLAERLRGVPLEARASAELVAQIASGVASAHQCLIVHRDLKPGNVLLENETDWLPKVTDFGLAKRMDEDHGATATGSILGTPAYMAPEQAFGGSKHVGPAADIYSIGAILYECLTGRPPFRGVTIADTLDQVRKTEPVPVRMLQPQVPRDLETIAHKCLRKEPGQRYATAAELVDDLQRFLRGDPIKARRVSHLEFASRFMRRNPVTSGLAAASLLMLVSIAVASTLFAHYFSVERVKAIEAQKQARLGEAKALLGQAHGIRQSRQPGQRFEALRAIRQAVAIGRELDQPPDWFAPARNEAIGAILLSDAFVEDFREETGKIITADANDERTKYAVAFGEGFVSVRRWPDQTELAHITAPDGETSVWFVGENRLLLGGHKSKVYELWNLETAKPVLCWRHESGFGYASFRRDGKLIAVSDSRQVRIVETATGRILADLKIDPFNQSGMVAVHPQEPLVLLYSYYTNIIQIRDFRDDRVMLEFSPHIGTEDFAGYSGVDWSPDGKEIAVLNGNGSSHFYSFDGSTCRISLLRTDRPSKIHGGGGLTIRYSEDGDRFYHFGWANRLLVTDANTTELVAMARPMLKTRPHFETDLSRDGNTMGFFRDPDQPTRMGMMSVADGRECYALKPESKLGHVTAIAPNGRFAAANSEGGFSVFDPNNGDCLLSTQIKALGTYNFVFDRVGNLYSGGQAGCFQWPYKISGSTKKHVVFGVPERVQMPKGQSYLNTSDDGRTLSAASWDGFGTHEYAGNWIKTSNDAAPRKIVCNLSGTFSAVSPNGDFVANMDDGLSVYSCEETVRRVHQISKASPSHFSRDGRRLFAGGAVLSVGDWTKLTDLGDGKVFGITEEGSLAFSLTASGTVRILNTQTGNELARVDGLQSIAPPVVSFDGSKLLYPTEKGASICDLRRVRLELELLGLDWDAPRFSELHEDQSPVASASLVPELQAVKTSHDLADLVDGRAFALAAFNPLDPDRCFSAAMVAVEKHQYWLARGLLNWNCWLQPQATGVRRWRACLLAEMGNLRDACRDADWILERIEDTDLQLISADWLYQRGLNREAIERLLRIEVAHPLGRLALLLRSLCHTAIGESEEAESDAAELDAKLSRHLDMLDQEVRPRVGRDISLRCPTLALQLARRMQQIQPGHTTKTGNTIALALYRNRLFEEAADLLAETLSKKDEASLGYDLYLHSMVLRRLGQTDEAEAVLDRANAWRSHPRDLQPLERYDLDSLMYEAVLQH